LARDDGSGETPRIRDERVRLRRARGLGQRSFFRGFFGTGLGSLLRSTLGQLGSFFCRRARRSGGRRGAGRFLTTANDREVRRNGDVDGGGEAVDAVVHHRKPASRVQQVTGVIADIGQLETLHRAVIG